MKSLLLLLAACGASVTGTVRSPSGQPLEGVTVVAVPVANSPDGISPPRAGLESAVTRDDGTFTLHPTESGKWLLVFYYAASTVHRIVEVTGTTVVDQVIDEHGPAEVTCTTATACEPTRR